MTKFLFKLNCLLAFITLSFSATNAQVIGQTYATCSYVIQANITQPNCFGNGNGHVQLVFSGVTDSPQLEWIYPDGTFPPANVDSDTPVQENLFAGNYRVRIQDNIGCVDTIFISLPEPDEVQFSANKTNVSCPGETDGSLAFIAEGGVGNFKFSLDGDNFFENPIFEQLPPAEYEVFVKDDNDCIKSKIVTINEPAEPEIEVETEDVNCPDGNDAVFIVVIDSGVLLGDYDYSLDGMTYQADSTFEDLEAGEYTIYARNNKGCITTKNKTINEPAPPNITINKADVSCNGGDNGYAAIDMSGGTSPYQFSLDDINFQTEILFPNLTAGTYQLFILDANGCNFDSEFQIFEPTPLENNITLANATCGLSNGWIASSANGGVSPFSYAWSNGKSEPTQTNLDEGFFKITVTDILGCEIIDTVELINEHAPLVQETIEKVSCFEEENGSIDLAIKGFEPFEIEWSNNEVTKKIENLISGKYTVTITDKNNCLTAKEFEVLQPDSISIFPKIFNTGPTGGVDLQVQGGTPPFLFEWNTGQKSEKVVNLNYGTYSVTITDANNCVGEKTFELDLPRRGVDLKKMVNIFPVPTNGDLFLDFNLPISHEMDFLIWDQFGKTIGTGNMADVKREKLKINVSQFPSGSYFIKIRTGNSVVIEKFVKVD